ncbi:conserved membrane protein of unknown function [Georgfuchsia toluolica]|uniref:DUF4870 domain-containing protein n=1 Tax=Georgfuchsia toluolica TaxID=424218 RepID=A0A916J349_9PROT|nr:hypothetical protein [Georgfuchsia toluolica]CAG4883113.1 conserved membrane protein of unknown function [Georgfuchsia toluolica]
MNESAPAPGQALAVNAELLYLVNLMLAPGLAFLLLAWLWLKHRRTAPALARQHLDQTFVVSLCGGALLIVACGVILALGGLDWSWTWVIVLLYFLLVHSTLIMFGLIGLSHAMAGKVWPFPLLGRAARWIEVK